MPLILRVDATRWREHLRRYVAAHPQVVPVVKGNGYGLGRRRLAAEVATLGLPTLAVGSYEELGDVGDAFAGDLLVLTPWRPSAGGSAPVVDDPRVIHTVSRLEDMRDLAGSGARVVLEVLTSVHRHGIAPDRLGEAVGHLDGVSFEGWALHLPLAGDRHGEAQRLVRALPDAGRTATPVWASHLDAAGAARLAETTATPVRLRVGTALWLGDRGALQVKASVLDVHRLRRGEPYGYRQRRSRTASTLLVVSGGTAHGVGLEAPSAAGTARQRALALSRGGLAASGRTLSPFTVGGRRAWFAEPPHMQCSLLRLPASVEPPAVGDEVDVEVRFTTTLFDRIDLTGPDGERS